MRSFQPSGPVLSYSLEGDFGLSPPNATAPAPEVGHEVKLINFGGPVRQRSGGTRTTRGTRTRKGAIREERPSLSASIKPDTNGFNRPTNIRFGPDGCAYVVDYGAVRDLGADTHFQPPGSSNGPLVQIPGTGAIFKICRK